MAETLKPNISAMELLLQCKGRPVRVCLFDPIYKDRLGRYPGILAKVSTDSIRIDCLDAPPAVPAETAATVELVCEGKILWCHTSTLPDYDHIPYSLRLGRPEKLQTEQQRRSLRAEAYLPVHYLVPGRSEALQGVILNISTSGAALQGAAPLRIGDVIALVFSLGSGLYFQDVQAEVLRCTSTRAGLWITGLRFLTLETERVGKLSDWVKRHANPDHLT
ncbi:MAG TPA: PilZ domain-containing protein [Symbiobacteriaceae bacterium]|nr:PilZ domain-containing protein [Symbiobacteriaceae bacterium]